MGIEKYNLASLKHMLDDVIICKQMFCTKDGEVYSLEAEEFLACIGEYKKYCIPEKVENWSQMVRDYVYSQLALNPDFLNDERANVIVDEQKIFIIQVLYHFINAAKIMEAYDKNKSWDDVSAELSRQGHTGHTFFSLLCVIVDFSQIAREFMEKYVNFLNFAKLQEMYEKLRLREEKRTALQRSFVDVLKRKLNNDVK